MDKIEYRVRPVTRYIVTRYEEGDGGRSGASTSHGEFDNPIMAFEVAYALCKAEHQRLGWPVDDQRILYPRSVVDSVQIGTPKPDQFSLARI
jgi:hypothetical protein